MATGEVPPRERIHRETARVTTALPGWAAALGFAVAAAGVVLLAWLRTNASDQRLIAALFALNFVLLGAIVTVRALAGIRLRRLRAERPGHPWTWDHPWNRLGATTGLRRRALRAFTIVSIFVIFLVPFNLLVLSEERHWIALTVVALLDLAVAGAASYAIVLLIRALRFGEGHVSWSRFPCRCGDDASFSFSGVRGLAGELLKARLLCISEFYERRGASDDASLVHEVLWSDRVEIRADSQGRATFHFTVPPDAPSTDLAGSPPRYWELEINAERSGLDFHAIVLVPMYGPSDSAIVR